MNGNTRLPSVVLVMILITLSSQAISEEHLSGKFEILSPQASQQYFENVDIQFQIQTIAEDSSNSDIHKQVQWRITNRFTRKTHTFSSSEFSESFKEGIYDIEVIFVDSSGDYSMLARSAFGVLHKPALSLMITKEKKRGLWFVSSYKAHLVWQGAGSEVEIYHKKACGEGFTRRQNCEAGFRKIYTGKNIGSFTIPYHKDDYFQVCNLGPSSPSSPSRAPGLLKIVNANDSCSLPVIVPRQ
ncbi:MAG: hypothetical protein COA96_17270 [SAR86 cluster bacterium]|uniref:Uncharacterized protein n=1 Tax=SAR86 cluster bacterium TaxID=2030880 RepID=A0A2A5AF31_9GAMM|nr:MAG: hypothetical protein COA96_17270 [SAR86 cluster bacterium]